jgi:hypothetical protein
MSNRYKGGVISATPPTTTGGNDGVASGAWTLEQQMQAQAAGLWPNQPIFYIEDVFSTYLYTGDGGTQTITNGINLSGKGGLVWVKCRSAITSHVLTDSANGAPNSLNSDSTAALANTPSRITSLNNNGFSVGDSGATNTSAATYCSWTFRKQPKFFDIQTWTGTGSVRTIAHNLGSVPACIIVKCTSNSGFSWAIYHRSLTATQRIFFDAAAAGSSSAYWNDTEPTSTVFTVGTNGNVNQSGNTFVAYLFAHNAGGFGLTGTDNVISCGSYTTDASGNATVNLGYEPQFVIHKNTTSAQNWRLLDVMRGMTETQAMAVFPNLSDAEGNDSVKIVPTATGFNSVGAYSASQTIIYIAIRRGPMKVPTSGTSVFSPVARAGTSATATVTTNFVTDSVWSKVRNNTGGIDGAFYDRLRGVTFLVPNTTSAELSNGGLSNFANNTGYNLNSDGGTLTINSSSYNYGNWAFRRAPGFFDEVCYTVSGFAANNVAHNLTVTPEIFITKPRGSSGGWTVYGSILGTTTKYMTLNADTALQTSGIAVWAATSTTFSDISTVANGTYVAYLFATCAGVSKVGSYTGTGAAQTINCGFAAGARFVLIKRTDSTGDWNVWDSARGIIPANDPYLALNTTAAEVTGTDYIDTTNVGFDITSTAPAAINANGGTFIFLAIA